MHFTKFDFLTLWVKDGIRQTNIDWYVNHLGLNIGWDSPGEKLTLLQFPSKQAMTLLAHYPDDITLPEGEVRVCLTVYNLQETKLYLDRAGIHTTEIHQTPWCSNAFDFFDLQGTRLTATSLPALPLSQEKSKHMFHSYFLHIMVSDLSAARQWYSEFLGMIPVEHSSSEHYYMMRMPEDEKVEFPIFFSKGKESIDLRSSKETSITAIRPFFQLAGKTQLEQTHAIFKSNCIEVTEITGKHDDFMRWFDFTDPNGNQLHAIAY
ncbi:VOC family protein [Paenibacillus albiflavus]|uniref:VOC family protein n=1 Tax=Paenibacillus albiflavus TaxID=2545760 RepID=A0A4R4DXF8_9BACL|nr:VOC family protein [Paenibacillus albiflavus]TCZ69619.1 VOC family protein [Paenibacillus albiflavus]